jgi:glyoxylase-like metal-dependent hydrolase (beta-lactamase superfamily II)
MSQEIKIITLPLPFRMGSVNCYLVKSARGYLLIDTGGKNNRQSLGHELERAGCKPGDLDLILLTHGDFDHTGNAEFLHGFYEVKVAMHAGDAGMVEWGDMFFSRNKPNAIIRLLVSVFSRFGREERFTPDLLVEDGDSLDEYGIDARVISIPGHSRGSIGILLPGGDLFCGDLLVNTDRPVLNSLIDDLASARDSLQKLAGMEIGTVYPGHGEPFPLQRLMDDIFA